MEETLRLPYLNQTKPANLHLTNEDAMIDAARAGDLEAFNQLVVRYQDRAYGLAYRIMADEAAAADATQEAFISAYKHLDSFRGGSFKSWLYRIVVNACYDALRYHRRRAAISLDPSLDEDEYASRFITSAEADCPDMIVQRRELAKLLQHHIARLPIDQRTVLVLSDVQGLSYQEIAEATRSSLGTVKSRLSRGRARMRQSLWPHLKSMQLV